MKRLTICFTFILMGNFKVMMTCKLTDTLIRSYINLYASLTFRILVELNNEINNFYHVQKDVLCLNSYDPIYFFST